MASSGRRRVPHPNVVLFDVRVGFRRRFNPGIFPEVEKRELPTCDRSARPTRK